MRKIIQYTMLGLMLCSLLALNSCVRSDVDDPGMDPNAGFFINLSGVANPGTLFVTQGGGWQNSYITMNAKFNDGTPVVGRNILMKIGEEFGTFPGDKRTAVITTNSQGTASIRYSISQLAIDQIGPEMLIYIQAWMQGDLINVYDLIPIQLVTNMPDDGANALAVLLIDTGVDPMNIPNTGGTVNYQIYNSKGDDGITFLVTLQDSANNADWVGLSTPSGTTPTTLVITIADGGTGATTPPRTAVILITATGPDDVVNDTETITIHQL